MNRIKTKLKFVKSDRSGSWVGFVSINPKSGCIKGVREKDRTPKKVCIVSHELACVIEPNVLYDVEMIPMQRSEKGYIVMKATPHAFEAKVSSFVVKDATYRVEVKFGNKTIVYDPVEGRKDTMRSIDGVAKLLEHRKDIQNITQVIDDFYTAANIVSTTYLNDKFNGNGKIGKKTKA
jgi:hypothetical protein